MSIDALCPVCFAPETSLEFHQDLRRCLRCLHLSQWPLTITARYDSAYVAKYAKYPLVEISHLRIGFVKAFVDTGRLLDVGHCRGDFVRAAARAGFDAWGYDITGVDVGIPFITKLETHHHWDVVTFFDSLEHFDSLDAVRELASRARWIFVACPFLPQDFPVNREWKHYRPGEHLHYFGAESLRQLFAGHELARGPSDVEDAVRGTRDGKQNIGTWVFRARTFAPAAGAA